MSFPAALDGTVGALRTAPSRRMPCDDAAGLRLTGDRDCRDPPWLVRSLDPPGEVPGRRELPPPGGPVSLVRRLRQGCRNDCRQSADNTVRRQHGRTTAQDRRRGIDMAIGPNRVGLAEAVAAPQRRGPRPRLARWGKDRDDVLRERESPRPESPAVWQVETRAG